MNTPIVIGEVMRDWSILKEKLEGWAVGDHFAFKVKHKDQRRADYVCRMEGCSWRVYASKNQAGEIEVKILSERHTCIGRQITPRETYNTQSWLRRIVPQHLFVTRDTTIREILESIQLAYGVSVNREAARLARASLINDRVEHQQQQFFQLPAYLALLRSKNPWIHTALHTIVDPSAEDGYRRCFQRVFICPAESQLSFIQMRKFMALDGTFLKARFVQTLLLAVGIDANGKTLILAWAVVESENTASWTWFLENLKCAIPQSLSMTLISDCDKGLLAADIVMGNHVTRAICCFHLSQNFKQFRGLDDLFWPIANAKTTEEYDTQLEIIRQQNPAAANYLQSVNPALWVTAFFPGRNYGHKTSNIVESMNHLLKSERELSILDLLNEIWHITMETRYQRYSEACQQEGDQTHTDFAFKQLVISREWSRHNTVRYATRELGEVTQANDRVYIVDLARKRCTCGHFQENDIPCGHAFSFILALGESPKSYLPVTFQISTWKATYERNITPITLDDIPAFIHENPQLPVEPCFPPTKLRAPHGRPKRKRMTRGEQHRRTIRAQATLNITEPPPESGQGSQQCRKCGNWGHNRKTCHQEME